MFSSRRKRATSNPPLNGSNANPAATTAATSAFLKNRASNAALSSAAAAAALRSRPTTPISVADVQTKRTVRRTASNTSMGSSAAGSVRGARPSLERRGSSGSMTERTFRDSSPGRASLPVPSALDAPPVPPIPQQVPEKSTKPHRRATSLEAPPMRVASPPPNQATGRGSSLGPGSTTGKPQRPGQRKSNLSSVSELTSIERPASRGSVNFSLPTGSRPTSPLAQRRLTSPSFSRATQTQITSTDQNLVYDPNTRSFLPVAEILAIEQSIRDAANKSIIKKKRVAPKQATGRYLADGTVSGRPRGTAIDDMEASASQNSRPVQPPAPASVPVSAPPSNTVPVTENLKALPKKTKKKATTSDSDTEQASFIPSSSESSSDLLTTSNDRVEGVLAKKPSIVHEDREREEEGDEIPIRAMPQEDPMSDVRSGGRQVSPSPAPRSNSGTGHGRGQALVSTAFAQDRQQARAVSQVAAVPNLPDSAGSTSLAAKDSIRGGRGQSTSPARTTHFAASPDNLIVKHQPPPRSISPRKSALKHSNSRGSSPVPGFAGSENSNGSVAYEEQTPLPRKKAVRVSFDEKNVVVGEAATPVTTDSPIVQSPQEKRKWYNIGLGKKKDVFNVDDQSDEVMKPRPALPSFGSVREKKSPRNEIEGRPLVKPAEAADFEAAPPSPPLFTPVEEATEKQLGLSKDHAIGAVISQDSTTKNAANISKSREPLPPKVLSVEGTGFSSETNSSLSSLESSTLDTITPLTESFAKSIESDETAEGMDATKAGNDDDNNATPTRDGSLNGTVPEIAVSQPTPTLDEADSKKEWLGVPGSWESSASESITSGHDGTPRASVEDQIEHMSGANPVTPATVGMAEPSPHGFHVATDNLHETAIIEETEESDASVYSDAAEDLSEREGDGFMSLDAVVDSPVTASFPGMATSNPSESPTKTTTKQRASTTNVSSGLPKKSSEPELDQGWNAAQEYWKGLSAEKQRQLELEAAKVADDGSDTEREPKPAPKPKMKKKKPVQSPSPADQHVPTIHSERSYMIQPGSKAGPDGYTSLRSSMRADFPIAPGDASMRKSMRGPGPGSMRDSMRGPVPAESRRVSQKKQRPASLPAGQIEGDSNVVKSHSRPLSSASAAAATTTRKQEPAPPVPVLRRKSSGDSDTSFKRTKPTNEMKFRRSMRAGSESTVAERQQSPVNTSRFSIRSLSPTGSLLRRPFSNSAASQKPEPQTQNHMRMSMRGNQGPAPTLRANSKQTKSPSQGLGFGRPSKSTGKQKPAAKIASRFADSSDEDERPAFRSRFADSSDDDSDEEPAPRSTGMRGSMRGPAPAPAPIASTTPLRGIPKRAGVADGDSSDLPDSDDGKAKSSKRGQNDVLVTSQGAILSSGSLRQTGPNPNALGATTTTTDISAQPMRPTHKRRGSLLSVFRHKKDPASKIRKADVESAARRDTPLERSKFDLEALRADQPLSPKLQKRNPFGSENNEQWPLGASTKSLSSPYKMPSGEDGRPYTADVSTGVTGSESMTIPNGVDANRPAMGTRRFTATGLSGVDVSSAVEGKGRKKKKFGALRRMFKLEE